MAWFDQESPGEYLFNHKSAADLGYIGNCSSACEIVNRPNLAETIFSCVVLFNGQQLF